LHIRIYVSFAPITPIGPNLSIVYQGDIRNLVLILIWIHLSKWLHNKAKWYHTCTLHWLILRSINNCCSHVFWTSLSFVYTNEGTSSWRRYFIWLCLKLFRNRGSHIIWIYVLDWSWYLFIIDFRRSRSCIVYSYTSLSLQNVLFRNRHLALGTPRSQILRTLWLSVGCTLLKGLI